MEEKSFTPQYCVEDQTYVEKHDNQFVVFNGYGKEIYRNYSLGDVLYHFPEAGKRY